MDMNKYIDQAKYLDLVKAELKIKSDYELAKRLEIPQQRISAIRKGKESLSLYTMTKVAVTLSLDPIKVIAEMEMAKEKNAKRREFWKGFISRATVLTAFVSTLGLTYSDTSESAQKTLGGKLENRPVLAKTGESLPVRIIHIM